MANPTFEIPKDVIEPIIQAQVAAAVSSALAGRDEIIKAAVGAVLNAKVDRDGAPDRYNSHNSLTWLQWVMNDCIRRAARAAIEQFLAGEQDRIKAVLTKELQAKNSPLAKQLVNGMLGAMANESTLKYRINVAVDER